VATRVPACRTSNARYHVSPAHDGLGVDTASVPVTFNAHAEKRLITGEDAMRIEVSETTGRLAIVAMQPFWASHRVLTFDLRINLPERDASRAK